MATKIWAHRGASAYAPENTIPAFKLALQMGADGLELDVHLSKDGKLMVIHDNSVDRTTNGTGRVSDLTCQELKQLDASNGFEQFANARIPTLKEVYGLIRNTAATVNVEIKCDSEADKDIWLRLVELENEMDMGGRVIYSSFNHYALMKLREAKSDARIGLLYSCALVDPWVYAKYLQADAIHPYYLNLRLPGLVEGCKKFGVAVHAWTVDDPAAVREAARIEVDSVITNKPDKAAAALRR